MGFSLFILVIILLLNIFFPRIGWHMRDWVSKGDVGPSDDYLLRTRISSAILLILVIIFWLFSI